MNYIAYKNENIELTNSKNFLFIKKMFIQIKKYLIWNIKILKSINFEILTSINLNFIKNEVNFGNIY